MRAVRRSVVALVASAAAALGATGDAAATLSPLRAVTGPDPAIVDGRGREVILRGFNVNQLGDYHRVRDDLAPTFALTERDFAQIAAQGANSVRLVMSWSALEPRPGQLDRSYVARVRRAVRWAARHDIYVVLDMHQDAWGKFIATPAGERCLPGLTRAQGWDGAPQWATITDSLTTCRLGPREVSPAVGQAFDSFYLDRNAIQTHLVRLWGELARALASEPNVAGYDLFNEPHPGALVGINQTALLGRFYARAIGAIRAGERAARGGREHVVFFEPSVLWSGLAVDATPPPTFTTDRNIVFSPHLYAESISLDQTTLGIRALTIENGFSLARATAARYRAPLWSGEWGWYAADPATDRPQLERYAKQEDATLIGGAYWLWKQRCGDPHSFISGDDREPEPLTPGYNRYSCPGDRPLGIPESTRRILTRPYPRAAPGRLSSLSSDPVSRRVVVRGEDPDRRGSCRLEVWVPRGTGSAPRPRAINVRRLRVRRRPGGWTVSGCATGAYELRAAPRA